MKYVSCDYYKASENREHENVFIIIYYVFIIILL